MNFWLYCGYQIFRDQTIHKLEKFENLNLINWIKHVDVQAVATWNVNAEWAVL